MREPTTLEPIAISIHDAERVSGISRRTLYDLMRDGAIQSRKVGRRRLVLVRSLRAYLEGGENGQATGAW